MKKIYGAPEVLMMDISFKDVITFSVQNNENGEDNLGLNEMFI